MSNLDMQIRKQEPPKRADVMRKNLKAAEQRLEINRRKLRLATTLYKKWVKKVNGLKARIEKEKTNAMP